MMSHIAYFEKKYNIKVYCSQETEPLGTAGPIRLAKDILLKDGYKGNFFVFNSDVLCEFPLEKLVEFHNNHKKEGTILVTKV